MTTLEIVLAQIDSGACKDGRDFAEAHPDPREAVAAALASEPKEGEHDTPGWHFLRWAVLCLDDDAYNEGLRLTTEPHTKKCGEYLRDWLDLKHPVSENK